MLAAPLQIARTVRQVASHPLNRSRPSAAIARYLRWQIGSRLLGQPALMPFGQRSHLLVRTGMSGATQNIYCGLHEFEDMAFVMHVLRPGDHFVDVGANIGSYTVLAAEAGARCTAFEPAPGTFASLAANMRVNRIDADLRNAGVGASPGVLRFTTAHDSMNHVLADDEDDPSSVDVPILPLDQALSAPATVIKVDVEGFEQRVIEGAGETLANPALLAVLLELNGSGQRYGLSDADVAAAMTAHGFAPHTYSPFSRKLQSVSEFGREGNTLFLRDVPRVGDRLRTAPPTIINGVSF